MKLRIAAGASRDEAAAIAAAVAEHVGETVEKQRPEKKHGTIL